MVRESSENDILVIADGAAFGPEMAYVTSLARFKNVRLFLPESFEWLVLNSSLFNDARTRDILLNPADYIESADFFSWEQFFTKELVEVTADTYLAYRKKSLNTAYLQPKEMAALKKALPDLGL